MTIAVELIVEGLRSSRAWTNQVSRRSASVHRRGGRSTCVGGHQLGQGLVRLALGAVHRARGIPVLAGHRVAAEVGPQLPGPGRPLPFRGRTRPDTSGPCSNHGQSDDRRLRQRPEVASDVHFSGGRCGTRTHDHCLVSGFSSAFAVTYRAKEQVSICVSVQAVSLIPSNYTQFMGSPWAIAERIGVGYMSSWPT